MKKVDIVIPIYNAYEYTLECIESVINNSNLIENRLILINDKSPDTRILPMLEEFANNNKDKKIIIINNNDNLGFVKTVNIGMKYSLENDVILLNSDTEVTKDWISKMQTCAYSNKYIATVTALTNNGTIASVPNFGIDNELPKNITMQQYANLIENISIKRYPELTTGNGFCLYIKRSVLNELGYFDDITFEKGYGEENDFCYRALDHGYTNVLCDDTFIYHKGTQSFKKENLTKTRAEVIEDHMCKLKKRYPIYVNKTDIFLSKNPLEDIQYNIFMNSLLYQKKKVLFLVNEWEENLEMIGGTSLHIKDIIQESENANLVLAPNKYDLTIFDLFLYVDNYGKKVASFKTDIELYNQISYTNNMYKEMLENVIDSFGIDVIHVHHLLYQTFDIIDIANKRNIYSIITLHDLYMICPTINMIYENSFCELNDKRDCMKCLKIRYGINSDIISNWQNTCHNFLKKFDKIIVPSNNTKEQLEKIYKDLKIEVVEHGVNVIKVTKPNNSNVKREEFNVAFVGAMVEHKGSNILKDMINKNKNRNVKIHLFGRTKERQLRNNQKNYIYHGEYKREDLPQLLINNNIDLVCIFAIWPETYSYTLSDVYMAHVPILTFDIGAVYDRINNDKLGWVLPYLSDTQKILSKIDSIRQNEESYNNVKENFKNYQFNSIEKMREYYNNLYNTVQSNNKIFDTYKLQNFIDVNKKFEFKDYKDKYHFIVYRYELLRRTPLWRILKKIKSKIKNIIRK